jgi:UDP-GlcNAc:undecaprenyl-phosphate/decaprenyl-phosphate GlcNAc-1-phosphate transferase
VVIAAVGLIDDYRHLRGKHKLLGQILAVAIVVACGVQVRSIQFFEWRWELGPLAVPFTMFILLGAINSLNLIDGMDGLLSSMELIICLAMGAMAFLTGASGSACVAMALAGALLGFLRYNFPPASIFVGDCGSMLVGLVAGVLAIQSSLKGPATVALAAPLAVLTLPIFDTLAAIVRRKLTGRSLYATDRGHMHHCMLGRGLTTRHVLSWVSALGLVTLVGALASVALRNELFAILSAAAVVCILIATKLFGFAELLLLKNRLSASAGEFFRRATVEEPREVEFHMHGNGDWGRLWRELTAFAIEQNLGSICLDVNAPAIQETYHARWSSEVDDPADFGVWRAELPVVVQGQSVGRLEIAGKRDQKLMGSRISALALMIEEFELTVREAVLDRLNRSPVRLSSDHEFVEKLCEEVEGGTALQQLLVAPKRPVRVAREHDFDINTTDWPKRPR